MFVMRVVVQVSKMKKIIVGILCVATAVPSVTLADGYHRGGGRGGINPWPIVAGAVIGTIAGANAAQSNQEAPTTQYRVVRRCENTMQYTSEQVLTGYKNSANFKDRMIEVISEQPLKQIPVTTTYSY